MDGTHPVVGLLVSTYLTTNHLFIDAAPQRKAPPPELRLLSLVMDFLA